ncbi:MAG: DUF1134 domain-containing protein [Sphingomonadales bacterium]|nr:DUF1134 domain-containing protein [Sphingomonadales bacterium]
MGQDSRKPAAQGAARTGALVAAAFALAILPGTGQAQTAPATTGPAIDSDLVRPGAPAVPAPAPAGDPTAQPRYMTAQPAPAAPAASGAASCTPSFRGQTYNQEDLISAAEGVFGTGAKGLASLISDVLAKQGKPNGYIAGREAGGAIAVGLRYGSGTICSTVFGRMPVYWNGPSVGFDFGANAAKTFVLVYNLNNPDDLFHRYVAGEGQAYLVGGFHVSYLRYGNVVLIPVRMGVGLRLGVNGGYMKITRKLNYVPF